MSVDNPQFWIQVVRTQAHVTDCREKTQALTNAANALERVIAEHDADRSALSESALKVALIASKAQTDLSSSRAECERLRSALCEVANARALGLSVNDLVSTATAALEAK